MGYKKAGNCSWEKMHVKNEGDWFAGFEKSFFIWLLFLKVLTCNRKAIA